MNHLSNVLCEMESLNPARERVGVDTGVPVSRDSSRVPVDCVQIPVGANTLEPSRVTFVQVPFVTFTHVAFVPFVSLI